MYSWLMMFWSDALCKPSSCFNNEDTVEKLSINFKREVEKKKPSVIIAHFYEQQDSQWQANIECSLSLLYCMSATVVFNSHRLNRCV